MATFKVKFRPSTVPGNEGRIFYQIIHNRVVRQMPAGYMLFPEEWNERLSVVVTTGDDARRDYLLSIRERIRHDVERLGRIDRKLCTSGLPYSALDIISEFERYSKEFTLFNYMEHQIAKLKLKGKIRTSETYSSTLSSVKNFRDDCDVLLDAIDTDMMEAYEVWLRQRGVALNTISFYFRILRAVYNRAVDDEIIDSRNPFRHVYTGIGKTVKRALPIATLKVIKGLDLGKWPALDYARDIFMLSFYLRGMSFVDMAFLRKNDLKDGHVTYRRRKTGQLLSIAWTKEMQEIVDKYPANTTAFLLPIIRNAVSNERCAYRNAAYRINRNLKSVAKLAGISISLTMYVARHSWASAAKMKGIPLSVISEGMGHENEATTRIYLASLDTSVVDRANSLILSEL